jgi:HSP20 family protein
MEHNNGGKHMAISDIIPWRSLPPELGRPHDPFSYLHSEIDRAFENVLGWGRSRNKSDIFAPQLDVTETDKEVKVCAELPGIESKDLDVKVTDDELTIRGEKRSERESGDGGRYCSERSFGSFERTIPLPTQVDGEKATSEFRNGVLRISLPKGEGAKPRSHKIPVT